MKVKKYSDVKPTQELPGVTKREVVNANDGAPNFCMRVFEIQPGSNTPSHSHNWEHEIYVLSGKGVVVCPEGETPISKDSVVFIPANEHHRIINKGKTVLQFICLIPFIK
ncbi:MAG: cupin domain-containing protein [Dehalococcoidales bacterium]|nr:cupin domain-containing protein [Dehalococcoidales bacterium]